jgi:hypothetical protein
LFKSDGTRKTYVPAREYLRKVHASNYGRPLYYNQAQNFMMLGSRGFGKSYSVAAIVSHEFLFNGSTYYTQESILNPSAAEIIVGAYDTKYSNDLLEKVRIMIERLPGEYVTEKKIYPAPFSRQYKGS